MSLKNTLNKSKEQPGSPITLPHQPVTLHSCLCLLCCPENRVASPLQQHHRHVQSSELTRLTGTKPLGCQDDASAVSKSGAQFRLPQGKKLEQVSRTSLSHAVSSHIYPSLFHGLSTVLHLSSTHRLEGKGWLCSQAVAEGAETLLEGQSSHLPRLEDIRS